MPWQAIADQIGMVSGQSFALADAWHTGGGCINQATVLVGRDGRSYFVKLNDTNRLDMFEAEAAGLEEILRANVIRAPRPLCSGKGLGHAWLVLEYIELSNQGDAAGFGCQLAALHRVSQAQFGWWRGNTIGATPQCNDPAAQWVDFWRSRRLGYQLELAKSNGAPGGLLRQGERLMAELPAFFGAYAPQPSLLHGDLWGGNHGFCGGEAVIFDPAVYYGDREADLAMTELFGGFPANFYAAYQAAWPLDPGYSVRKTLYNLYHILNHFNLFGGSYSAQAERMSGQLLAELG